MKKTNTPQVKDAIFISSVIGNLLQAIGQAEKAKNLQTAQNALSRVTAEREYLKSQLRLWINESNRLKHTAKSLVAEIDGLGTIISEQNNKIYTMNKQQNEYEKKIDTLTREKEQLEKRGK